MPPGTVKVDRTTRWGNPFRVRKVSRDMSAVFDGETKLGELPHKAATILCIQLFRLYATSRAHKEPDWLKPLCGKDVACWCRMGSPCHADAIINIIQKDRKVTISEEITNDWLEVFQKSKSEPAGLKSIFFRLALTTLPVGVSPEDPRVVAAIEEIRKANNQP